MISSLALVVIWFLLPWNSLIAPVILGCGCLCGICSTPYVARLLFSIKKRNKVGWFLFLSGMPIFILTG